MFPDFNKTIGPLEDKKISKGIKPFLQREVIKKISLKENESLSDFHLRKQKANYEYLEKIFCFRIFLNYENLSNLFQR